MRNIENSKPSSKRNWIIALLIYIIFILSFQNSNAQSKIDGDFFYFVKDSCLLQYNSRNDSVRLIYKQNSGSIILDYESNWKQGIIILIENKQYSYILQIKNSVTNKIDTIYSLYQSDGEGFKAVTKINISPTGDFMELDMAYWEWSGIRFFDFRKKEILKKLCDTIYLTHFIKWIPFNSVLAARGCNGIDDCPDNLTIYNINLENKLSKSWFIPMTTYLGFIESYDGLSILCSPENPTDKKLKGINLDQMDIYEIRDTTNEKILTFKNNSENLKATLILENDITFKIKLENLDNNELKFYKSYKLTYPSIDDLIFKSIEIDKDLNTILIKFNALVRIDQNSRAYKGSILYSIDLNGRLIKKAYINIFEYREGFNLEKYEYSDGIVKKYVNNRYTESFKDKKSPLTIPMEIILE